ncbi:uncharacterized protein LOC123263969 [Cotesia glomerata]|uniref:Uncharacterized protein n=1 Tax=Cotesia glomerata TaxID=32391 RepID=A0AAV7ITY7_COTGL|nr:uncharacterized protein LOC123263969 [Cotesia glomerata]KAH0568083.1 hypothetical protein KQX54_018161 [Cotesia glomerata]
MIKLLDEKIKQFNRKSRAYNHRHYYREVIDIPNVLGRLKHDEGKFENNVTKPGDNPCLNTPHINDSFVKYETFNNYIDYLEKNAEENKIADPTSIATSKPENQLVDCTLRWDPEDFMDENYRRVTGHCDKCNVMTKLLNEKIKRCNEKSKAYNRRYHNRDIVDKHNMWERSKNNLGKFENKITDLGNISCLNTHDIYADPVEYETLNNYIDYLEKYAEENKIVDPSSIATSKSENHMMGYNPQWASEKLVPGYYMNSQCQCDECSIMRKLLR